MVIRTIASYWLAKDAEYLDYGSVILPDNNLKNARVVGYVDGQLTCVPIESLNDNDTVHAKDGQMYLLGYKAQDYVELLQAQKDGVIIATDWSISDKNRNHFWPTPRTQVHPCYEFKAKTMSYPYCRSISGEIVGQHGNYLKLQTSKGEKDVLVVWNNMSRKQHERIEEDDGVLISICRESFEENFNTKSRPIFYYH